MGLSRAKSGLNILGNMRMHEVRWPNNGCRVWQQLINHHRTHNALLQRVVADRHIQEGENHFGLRGNQYRTVARRDGL